MTLSKTKIGSCVLLGCWTSLGFYRGVKEYDYFNNNYCYKPKSVEYDYCDSNNRYYKRNQKDTTSPYLYSDNIAIGFKTLLYGVFGAIIYIHPFFSLCTIPKELYRLEVCVRGLEDEKKTERYKRSFELL